MNLRDVESIVKIAQEGNIARAAEKLFITPSALTQQLQHLEEDIGTPLFTRSRKGCTLTDAGAIYLESAKKLLEIRRDTYNRLQDISSIKKGTLSIGLPPERGVEMFRYLYPRFHNQYPGITICVHEVNVLRQQSMIADGQLDLGFMTLCQHQKTADEYQVLHKEEILLALPAAHPACRLAVPAENRPFPLLDIRSLAKEPFALIFNGSTLRDLENRIFQEAGFAPLILFETARLSTILAMAPATPFSSVFLVKIFLGVMPSFNSSITARPEALAMRFLLLEAAKAVPAPGSAMPSTSDSIHMELAVPKWAQLPTVGRAAISAAFISSAVTAPVSTRPGYSRSSLEQNSGFPPTFPGSIGPPGTITAGMSSLAAAIIIPGIILSHPANSTIASK